MKVPRFRAANRPRSERPGISSAWHHRRRVQGPVDSFRRAKSPCPLLVRDHAITWMFVRDGLCRPTSTSSPSSWLRGQRDEAARHQRSVVPARLRYSANARRARDFRPRISRPAGVTQSGGHFTRKKRSEPARDFPPATIRNTMRRPWPARSNVFHRSFDSTSSRLALDRLFGHRLSAAPHQSGPGEQALFRVHIGIGMTDRTRIIQKIKRSPTIPSSPSSGALISRPISYPPPSRTRRIAKNSHARLLPAAI